MFIATTFYGVLKKHREQAKRIALGPEKKLAKASTAPG